MAEPNAELWTEVRVSFAGTLVEVAHLRPGQSFTLGESPEADLTYATPGLHRLVIATATGAVLELLDSRELIALGAGEWTRVELGALSIEIGCAAQLVPELGRRPVDRGWWLSLMSTALLVVPFLILALEAGQTVLPPLETDAAPYLAYTVRSQPAAEQPRDELRPPPPDPQRAREREDPRRKSAKPRDAARPNSAADVDATRTRRAELEALDRADLPDSVKLARARPGPPRSLPAMLRRDSSPVEAARMAGTLGAMPDREALVAFGSVAAASFSPDVDDSAMWAAMTDGPIDTTIGGLELVGSGRGGGEASEIIRSGAPERPQAEPAPVLAKCMGRGCDDDRPRSLRARMIAPRIDGELGARKALAFANSLGDEWVACLGDDAEPVEFEVRYSVGQDGRISGVEVPRRQLSAKSRRCIEAALEGHSGPGPTGDGKVAAVVQRVELR